MCSNLFFKGALSYNVAVSDSYFFFFFFLHDKEERLKMVKVKQ